MTRPTRSNWQQHQHMRSIEPAPYRYAKATRAPKLTVLRALFIAAAVIAWALIGPVLFAMVTA